MSDTQNRRSSDGVNYHSIQTDVELLKRDMHQLNDLFGRLDVTIEKLSEVSSNLVKIIAVHESKFQHYENNQSQTQNGIELIFERLEDRKDDIQAVKEECRKEVEKTYDEILEEIKETKQIMSNSIKDHDDRIKSLEKWKWMLLGGGFLLGTIVNFVFVFVK